MRGAHCHSRSFRRKAIRYGLLALLVAGAVTLFSSCALFGTGEDNVTLSVSTDEYTEVEVQPRGTSVGVDGSRTIWVDRDTIVTLTATVVDDSAEFLGWSGDIDAARPSVSFTIERSMSVQAASTVPEE